jgi:peptidoglycan hydrolase-like protein with peptidoglycan-binding domain
MSNSPLVSYTKISPNKTSPRQHAIDTVTIHCVVGQLTVESLGQVFANANRRSSSNYGIGLDGKIGMYVEEKDRSWCSSNPNNDHRAITIEVASDAKPPYSVTDAAYKSLITLLADICKRNNIKELKWKGDKSLIGKVDKQNMTVHRWFANKDCPGEYLYSRHGQIANEVNKLLGVKKTATPSYTLKEFIKDIQASFGTLVDGVAGPNTLASTLTLSSKLNNKHKAVYYVQLRLKALGYVEIGKVDGIAGPKFTSAVAHFQQDNNCAVDGEITARAKTWKKLLGLA